METKSLLIGIISFLAGGLIVSIAATTFEKDETPRSSNTMSSMMMGMDKSVKSLQNKSGDEFDEAFINEMIAHHQGAIEMAILAETNAKHEEIKNLSKNIISTQQAEITEMKQWQQNWGYDTSNGAAGWYH